MKKIFFFLLFTYICCINEALGQVSLRDFTPGLYRGGDYISESSTFGSYWFGKDSSFVIVGFRSDTSISYIGAGKWFIDKKGFLVRRFETIPDLRLNLHKIQYFAETKNSTDSIYITGILTDELGIPSDGCSVSLFGIMPSVRTNKLGEFFIQVEAAKTSNPILLELNCFYPLKIKLFPGYNYHVFNIAIHKGDDINQSFHSDIAFGFSPVYPKKNAFKKIKDGAFVFDGAVKFQKISDSKNSLLVMLDVAKLKQSHLANQLEWIKRKIVD